MLALRLPQQVNIFAGWKTIFAPSSLEHYLGLKTMQQYGNKYKETAISIFTRDR